MFPRRKRLAFPRRHGMIAAKLTSDSRFPPIIRGVVAGSCRENRGWHFARDCTNQPKPMSTPDIESLEYKKQFLHEATRLAIESVEKGWGGPFGAVIVKDGEIIGRGQNRVLLTGIPVYHAEVTAIIDACGKINTKALLGSDYYEGNLKMIPRPEGSPDPVPERAQMLKGCELYVNGAPCPMCMSAIYWARIDRVYFGTRLEDTSKIGFDDEFQYIDFRLPWEERKAIKCFPDFERDYALKACEAWQNKSDRHPY